MFSWIFGSWQTSLLCIVGELTGGGSVTVVVGNIDRWQVTRNTWNRTHDMILLLHDTWRVTLHFFFFWLEHFRYFGISATICARREISISRWRHVFAVVAKASCSNPCFTWRLCPGGWWRGPGGESLGTGRPTCHTWGSRGVKTNIYNLTLFSNP